VYVCGDVVGVVLIGDYLVVGDYYECFDFGVL